MTRLPVVLSIGLAISLAGPMAFRPALAQSSKTARLKARPTKVLEPATPGLDTLDVSPTRDAYIYVPRGYDPSHRAPLLVLLHGATQSADLWTRSSELFTLADSLGMVLLIPNSQDRTWDLMIGGFGPDVRVLDSALTLVFHRCNIDRKHVALGGFSDGASYALSLGVNNGDLFQALIAFSPGFFAPAGQVGMPRIFIAHGTADQILPINSASRRIVPMLQQAGYDVTYHEFDGPHTVKPEQARQAFAWFLKR